jgi:hypothetical protein
MAQWHCLPSGLQSAIPALANSSGNKDVLTKREMTLPGLLCLAGSCDISLDPRQSAIESGGFEITEMFDQSMIKKCISRNSIGQLVPG